MTKQEIFTISSDILAESININDCVKYNELKQTSVSNQTFKVIGKTQYEFSNQKSIIIDMKNKKTTISLCMDYCSGIITLSRKISTKAIKKIIPNMKYNDLEKIKNHGRIVTCITNSEIDEWIDKSYLFYDSIINGTDTCTGNKVMFNCLIGDSENKNITITKKDNGPIQYSLCVSLDMSSIDYVMCSKSI